MNVKSRTPAERLEGAPCFKRIIAIQTVARRKNISTANWKKPSKNVNTSFLTALVLFCLSFINKIWQVLIPKKITEIISWHLTYVFANFHL